MNKNFINIKKSKYSKIYLAKNNGLLSSKLKIMPSDGPIIYVKLFIFVVVLCLFAFTIMGSQQPAYYYSSPSSPEPSNVSNYMNPVNHQGLSATDDQASGPSGTGGYSATPPDNVEPDDQEEGYDEDNEDLAPP